MKDIKDLAFLPIICSLIISSFWIPTISKTELLAYEIVPSFSITTNPFWEPSTTWYSLMISVNLRFDSVIFLKTELIPMISLFSLYTNWALNEIDNTSLCLLNIYVSWSYKFPPAVFNLWSISSQKDGSATKSLTWFLFNSFQLV